jgi:hypothetical protein
MSGRMEPTRSTGCTVIQNLNVSAFQGEWEIPLWGGGDKGRGGKRCVKYAAIHGNSGHHNDFQCTVHAEV